MSTNYLPMDKIKMSELFDGRLARFQVAEGVSSWSTTPDRRCLVNDKNSLWVYGEEDGFVSMLTRYGFFNDPSVILDAIGTAMGTTIVSEHEPRFWGVWDGEPRDWVSEEEKDAFYDDLEKYLAGEPCDLKPGTVRWVWAEIAKQLVTRNLILTIPACRDVLLAEILRLYYRDEVIIPSTAGSAIAAHRVARKEW